MTTRRSLCKHPKGKHAEPSPLLTPPALSLRAKLRFVEVSF